MQGSTPRERGVDIFKPGKMQKGRSLLIIIAVSYFLKHILRNVFYFQVSKQLLEINHA